MPKQVRLRRGTTAQHTTFVGADGEVTFDTTKKVLVLHDGITPGGKPIEGFVLLNAGNPLNIQVLATCLQISGGNSDNFGLMVNNPALFSSLVTFSAGFYPKRVQWQHAQLVYGASVLLDFNSEGHKRLNLAGNVAFNTANIDYGKQMIAKILCDGSLRTLTFPSGWKFVGGTAPANIAANKTALLTLHGFGTTDADVVAHYLVEP
jgi:hypothetical protein